ncbi:signal peptidase I [Candidatus Woesearchaeota archaeon]|jgi:signal peptidase I|nr:signal peptidase I [Candidatus Woesearchaeota archaeon]MBT4322063.1 signal peptidase I [Candidatus Woesearchaeota archaeon]MBT4630640.1 signal peptidase I [Candidatus Woesearchaeota archaeon]
MNFKKVWNFLWHEDSIWSWIVSIILAFILVKFIIYPLIGLILGTGYPIVAVVSESMEHKASCHLEEDCQYPTLCGVSVDMEGFHHLKSYWENCGEWYENYDISMEEFEGYKFKNGFNKGDVIILVGREAKDIKVGDVVVFDGGLNYPIIHRVVQLWNDEEGYHFQTKGDNNERSSGNEVDISEDKLIGKAVFRLPLLGWVKIKFSEIINLFGGLVK